MRIKYILVASLAVLSVTATAVPAAQAMSQDPTPSGNAGEGKGCKDSRIAGGKMDDGDILIYHDKYGRTFTITCRNGEVCTRGNGPGQDGVERCKKSPAKAAGTSGRPELKGNSKVKRR